MTKDQAFIFFKYQPDDDLDDLWEQRFFDLKQFFLSRVPLKKLWLSKINRISKEYEAYLTLIEENEQLEEFIRAIENIDIVSEKILFSTDFIEAFNEFYTFRNQFKTKLLQTYDLIKFIKITKKWHILLPFVAIL